ncbi:MAG: putative manganese-dependent inorganic diphosphatase [Methanomicrobiales archaeon]|nr:putative manganese-dependent inorganic diphosphatase [Methanomicrobiales archaeon]
MHNTYVIGHRQPDTDSICSVIAYAELLNQAEPGRYIPARCGEVNPETAYALSLFRTDPPLYIESVEPDVADLPFLDSRSARQDLPTIDVVRLMEANDMRNMPITDQDGVLLGLVSEYGLARSYVTANRKEELTFGPITLETLGRILSAEILVSRPGLFSGRVYIAIDALHVTLSRLKKEDLAIVGDNEPAQLALLTAGIAALVVADGAPVGERVRELARSRGIAVMSTSLDAFGVGKMINLSIPAGQIMETDVPRLSRTDSVEYAKHLITASRYRTACVVDAQGKYQGLISRSALMQEVHKSVILLDHNEPGQAVEGIDSAEIMEIIDHHRLGVISTLKPVKFLNDPVGSTSTLIAQKYQESEVEPSPVIAGLLCAGILSDTLALKMSTTTPADSAAAEYLACTAQVNLQEFGMDLLRHGMELDAVPLEELLGRDTKRYVLFGKDVVIAQVMTPTFAFSTNHAEEIRRVAALMRTRHGAAIFAVLFTNIFEEASDLYVAADDATLARLQVRTQPVRLQGVMSRKKDFLPRFGEMLKQV